MGSGVVRFRFMTNVISWYDLVAVAVLAAGLIVGRKRGMSAELLDLLLWLAIVFGGAQLYPIVAQTIGPPLALRATGSCFLAYLLIATVLFLLAFIVRRNFGDKLVGADFFGGFEYYLGMIAGAARFACILLFATALLHAPRITDKELQAQLKRQNDDLGAIYFPPFGSIQRSVFQNSITGRSIKDHLGFVLIQPDPSLGARGDREGIGRAREREVNDVITPRR